MPTQTDDDKLSSSQPTEVGSVDKLSWNQMWWFHKTDVIWIFNGMILCVCSTLVLQNSIY